MNKGTFRKAMLIAALPAAALFCTSANAQSIYTDPDILELTPSQQTTIYRTIVRENVTPRVTRAPIVAQTEPRAVTRKQVRYSKTRSGNVVRTTTTDRIVRSGPVVRERIVTSQAPVTNFVTADSIDLSPNQRTVVYRTLVQQPGTTVVTGPALTSPYARPYVTTEPVVTAPGYGYGYGQALGYDQRVIAPSTTGVGVVTDAPGGYVPPAEIAIGAPVPRSVALYAMPAETIAAAPSLAGYRYALINGRVYLVDPRDGIVAAMLYQ